MRKSRKLAALGAFFVLAAGVAGCGSGIPGNSVASVAGNPITTQAFDHWMYVAAKGNAESEEQEEGTSAPVIVPEDPPAFSGCIKQVRDQIPSLDKTSDKVLKTDCAQLFTSLSSQVMDFLIKAYWYQADAHRLGIKLTNAEVTKLFNQAKSSEFHTATAFDAFLTESGQTSADILYRVRINQLDKELVARLTKKVTPAAISAYYAAHSSEFGTREMRNIRIVRTNSESVANKAKAALASGQSWNVVAKKYSIDPSKTNGGLLTGITNGEEETALNTVAFSAPLNKIEGPVHGSFGWYVVEVVKITPGTHESLAQATKVVSQTLTSQYETDAENALTKQTKKRFGAQTLCRGAWSMDDCHGYKAPKTTTTASTAAAGTSGAATTTAPSSTTATAPSRTTASTGTSTTSKSGG